MLARSSSSASAVSPAFAASSSHPSSSPFHSPLCRCWLGRGFWYWLFLIELPICLATVLFWLIGPSGYISGFVQDRQGGATHMETALLQQCANVVFCAYVIFYGRLLVSSPSCFSTAGSAADPTNTASSWWSRAFAPCCSTAAGSSVDPSLPATWCPRAFPHRQSFLWLQQAMGFGDGLMLLQCAYDWGYLDPKPSIIVGQVVMAGGYGLARLIFIIQQMKLEQANDHLTVQIPSATTNGNGSRSAATVAPLPVEESMQPLPAKMALMGSPSAAGAEDAEHTLALPRPTPRSSHTPGTMAIAVGAKQLRVEGEIDTPGSYQS